MKKNIIKKTSLSNNKFRLDYKREVKYLFKRRSFKYKKGSKLIMYFYLCKNILKTHKYIKYNLYKTKNSLLIYKNIYFNCITNGLDLKYENLYQELYSNEIYLSNYIQKNTIYSSSNNLNIVKLQKFITIIDNYFINELLYENSIYDYFILTNIINFSYYKEIYKSFIFQILIKIN